jgi:hypothetical protein
MSINISELNISSSELYYMSLNIFENLDILKYIVYNISYFLGFGKEYKPLYFIGNSKSILFFIEVLKDTEMLNKKILTQNEFKKQFSKSKIVVIENEPKKREYENCAKIFIRDLNSIEYFTNNDSVINFNFTKLDFDRIKLKEELDYMLLKYVNKVIQNEKILTYENYVFGEQYQFLLHNQIVNRIPVNRFQLEDIYNYFYMKKMSVQKVKEFLIHLLGKPIRCNEWERKRI